MKTDSKTISPQPEWLRGKGGRPKGGDEQYINDPSKLARRYTAEALRALRRIARDNEKTDPAISLRAWALLLERGHGKAAVLMENRVSRNNKHLASIAR